MTKKQKVSKKLIIEITTSLTLLLIIILAYFKLNVPSSCDDGVCDYSATTGNVVKSVDFVATYNGNSISKSEFNSDADIALFLQGLPSSYINQIDSKVLLNQTLIKDLLYEDAKKNGVIITLSQANETIKNLLSNGGQSLSSFLTQIENRSFTYNDFVNYYMKQLTITKYLNETVLKNLKLDDSNVKSYYDAHPELFVIEPQIRVSHILVNTSQEAKEIIQELENGANFSELAKERSIGPSAPNGGDLNFFGKGAMIPEFEDAAFSLENIGDFTTEPVLTKYGYHIIKLTDKKEGGQISFVDIKDELKSKLLEEEKAFEINNFVSSLVKNSNIQIFLQDEINKSETPNVELFVMSYCPYGLQMEKGILPVIKELNGNINFTLKFVNYVMHGEKEVYENMREYCIQKEQTQKFIPYLECFVKDGDSDACLTNLNIDENKLSSCMAQANNDYQITENFESSTSSYPKFLINNDDNLKYGVKGSPTLVIDGKVVQTNRDTQTLLNTICSSFTNKPSECDADLTMYGTPSVGFGISQGNSNSQSCGA